MSEADLETAVVQFVRGLPHNQVLDAARVLDHTVDPAQARPIVEHLVPTLRFKQRMAALLDAWMNEPEASGASIALALRIAGSAVAAERATERLEVVWTGPSATGVPVRHTYAVLVQVIDAAEQSLMLVSFATFKTEVVTTALRAAVARGVKVRLVLDGGTSADLAFESFGHDIELYTWPPTLLPDDDPGHATLHAKAAIADRETAFVTSANLTGYALEKNMELGLLVAGGPIPTQLADHFQGLLADGTLRRWAP